MLTNGMSEIWVMIRDQVGIFEFERSFQGKTIFTIWPPHKMVCGCKKCIQRLQNSYEEKWGNCKLTKVYKLVPSSRNRDAIDI